MNDVITPNSSGDGSDERIFLEAARSGDLDTVKRLCNTANVNCRDFEGRQSTPLHFAAGYNRVEVVEYLLTILISLSFRKSFDEKNTLGYLPPPPLPWNKIFL